MYVTIVNRSGEVVESVVDNFEDGKTLTSILYSCLKHEIFVLLRYISDYDRTVFNSLQVTRFLLEWELLKALLNEVELVVWAKIKDAILRHRGIGDPYLVFTGLD